MRRMRREEEEEENDTETETETASGGEGRAESLLWVDHVSLSQSLRKLVIVS